MRSDLPKDSRRRLQGRDHFGSLRMNRKGSEGEEREHPGLIKRKVYFGASDADDFSRMDARRRPAACVYCYGPTTYSARIPTCRLRTTADAVYVTVRLRYRTQCEVSRVAKDGLRVGARNGRGDGGEVMSIEGLRRRAASPINGGVLHLGPFGSGREGAEQADDACGHGSRGLEDEEVDAVALGEGSRAWRVAFPP